MIATVFHWFELQSAHFLPKVGEYHKCGKMHGHTYRVITKFRGEVGEDGFVIDYSRLSHVWGVEVHQHLDHAVLNEIDGLENPTSEHLAHWIWTRLAAAFPDLTVAAVEVWETMHAGATYEPAQEEAS